MLPVCSIRSSSLLPTGRNNSVVSSVSVVSMSRSHKNEVPAAPRFESHLKISDRERLSCSSFGSLPGFA